MQSPISLTDRSDAKQYLLDALRSLRRYEFAAADPDQSEHAWALDVAARQFAIAAVAKLTSLPS